MSAQPFSLSDFTYLINLRSVQIHQRSRATRILFRAWEEQGKKEVQGLTWAAEEASKRAAKAEKGLGVVREQLKGWDASILSLKDLSAASEAKVARAEADVHEAQAAPKALRLQDAGEAVDIGAYNILVGRIETLEAAEGTKSF